jgi:hypothetical protein
MARNSMVSLSHTQWHHGSFKRLFLVIAGLGLAVLLSTPQAHATASFSRQTGLACNVCHTTFPELTPF